METALILTHLIVVAALPPNVCTTDSDCERVAWQQFGCNTFVAERKDVAADNGDLFICDRATFERGMSQWKASHK